MSQRPSPSSQPFISESATFQARVSSRALQQWQTKQLAALDEIQAAHAAVEGQGPGRRYRTQQLNGAYVVLLAAQFQQFCRDLHSEAAAYVATAQPNPRLQGAILIALTQSRQLDIGNVNPGSLGTDYARFNMRFWSDVRGLDARNAQRQERLSQLNLWRNAIAHQNFSFSPGQQQVLADTRVTLKFVSRWRSACEALAIHFDRAVGQYLGVLVGSPPW